MFRFDWQTATGNDRYGQLASALSGFYVGEVGPPPIPGGRRAALNHLQSYDLSNYGRARNYLDAPVSRLAAYLRHGLLSITEVRDEIKKRYGSEPERTEEFLRQLAWRDYFEHVLNYHGDDLQESLEEPKHSVLRDNKLPEDIIAASTGLPCIDGMLEELQTQGYLHNHERLWFAAYLCHYRGISWKAGAQLFRQWLLDGDLASNSSSWQWVESTFAAKPYFMNKENINKFSGGRWCRDCTVRCPFDASYETLQTKLFETRRAPLQMVGKVPKPDPSPTVPRQRSEQSKPLQTNYEFIWLHDFALAPTSELLAQHPEAGLLYIFDETILQNEHWAFHRHAFIWDSLVETFQNKTTRSREVLFGTYMDCLQEFIKQANVERMIVQDAPDPYLRSVIHDLEELVDVVVIPRPMLAVYTGEPKRFSRYWEKAGPQVLGYQPKSPPRKFHK